MKPVKLLVFNGNILLEEDIALVKEAMQSDVKKEKVKAFLQEHKDKNVDSVGASADISLFAHNNNKQIIIKKHFINFPSLQISFSRKPISVLSFLRALR